jgi:hypothetical protein
MFPYHDILDDMIDSAEYTRDGKFLVLTDRWGQGEPKKVPVALIDELRERKLSSYDIEKLLFVRSLTAEGNNRKVTISELVNEDLTGKTVGIYFRNWEDSEWMSTSNAVGVVQDETDDSYRFVFSKESEECWNGECSHHDDPEAVDDCSWDNLQGTYFRGSETVLITTGDEMNG